MKLRYFVGGLVVIVSMYAAGARGDNSANVQGKHMRFSNGAASMSFSPVDGLTIKVGDHAIRYTRIGDAVSGTFVITTNTTFVTVPYSVTDGKLNVDTTRFDDMNQQFRADLPAGSDAELAQLNEFLKGYAALLGSQTPRGGRVRAEWSTCQAYQAAAIGAFVACPGSFGLGCAAGLFFLYEESQNC